MGLAMSGLTHCERCGQSLGMNRFGMCESCEKEQKQRKEKINMKKSYKGYELIKAIAEGNIKDGSRFRCKPFKHDIVFQHGTLVIDTENMPEIFILCYLNDDFELIETDIQELPELTSHINYDTYSIENNRHKINELVRAVNKMRKEMEGK